MRKGIDLLRETYRYFGKGLDVGTSFVRSAERGGQEVVFRSERTAFVSVDQTDFTESMLAMADMEYVKSGDDIFIVGNAAMEFANVSYQNVRRPLRNGLISPSESEALPMIEMIVSRIIRAARQSGESLYYSVPGEPLDTEVNLGYHKKTLQSMIEKLGYNAKPINEGLAVVFAELGGDEHFTGIGMSFGGGMVNVCFAYRSLPLLMFSITRSGDWIDERAAMAVGENASYVCSIKEKGLDLTQSDGLSKIPSALGIAYDELIHSVAATLTKQVGKMMNIPKLAEPLPVVLSGGTATPRGFTERFKQALRSENFPLEIARVKLAEDPFGSVARGAMIAAQAGEGAQDGSEASSTATDVETPEAESEDAVGQPQVEIEAQR